MRFNINGLSLLIALALAGLWVLVWIKPTAIG